MKMNGVRVELRTGPDALFSVWCATCHAALGPFPVRPVLVDASGEVFGLLCQECLTAPPDELATALEDVAEEFRALANGLQAAADLVRRRQLSRPTLGDWLDASQRAERGLL